MAFHAICIPERRRKKPGGPGLLTLNASWKKYCFDAEGNHKAAMPQHTPSVASARHASLQRKSETTETALREIVDSVRIPL